MSVSRLLRKNVILYLKGWGMGIADLIPGISGGTMALIFGIYEELIGAIKSVNIVNLKPILRGRWLESAEAMRLLKKRIINKTVIFKIFDFLNK